jgi:hypothetical protein
MYRYLENFYRMAEQEPVPTFLYITIGATPKIKLGFLQDFNRYTVLYPYYSGNM